MRTLCCQSLRSVRRPLSARRWRSRSSFSVDRSGLIGSSQGGDAIRGGALDTTSSVSIEKEPLTPLAKDLRAIIELKGPITMHEYMSQCSNHVYHGYYQSQQDKIGTDVGDFTTAPEISQLFGEMVGMWAISQWHAMGRPGRINILELGPGKGTLMNDVLGVARKFPEFHKAIVGVHMIELSDNMRKIQADVLHCEIHAEKEESSSTTATNANATATTSEKSESAFARTVKRPTSFPSPSIPRVGYDDEGVEPITYLSGTTNDGLSIHWYHTLAQVPEIDGIGNIVIAQEFLDVFPVHQFQYKQAKRQWLEKLVDVDMSDESQHHFRTVLSTAPTPAAISLLQHQQSSSIQQVRDNTCIEVSPLALATCEDIATRILRNKGVALFIDYGNNGASNDSVRSFHQHNQVSIFERPGECDITADVDFHACALIAARRGAKVIGAIPQAEFLINMGVVDRAEQLISAVEEREEAEQARQLEVGGGEKADGQGEEGEVDAESILLLKSLKLLIDENEMGLRFKVLMMQHPSIPGAAGFPSE